MTRVAYISPWVCLVCMLLGCRHSTTSKVTELRPATEVETTDVEPRRVDPRLLEETGERASKAEAEAGMAYHKTTKDADRFPALLRSSTLVHGGYSVRFVTRSNSVERVRHFIDEHGKWMRTDGGFHRIENDAV